MAYNRALKSEKSLSMPIPVAGRGGGGGGGGGVDTIDWCITNTEIDL